MRISANRIESVAGAAPVWVQFPEDKRHDRHSTFPVLNGFANL